MSYRQSFIGIILLILLAASSFAKDPNLKLSDGAKISMPSGPANVSRTVADSVLIMGPWGSGAPFNGQFQNQDGEADWNGWTHRDMTISWSAA